MTERMRSGGNRLRRSWRIGSRKAADYLVMARVRDEALDSLIARFPAITGMSSGEARATHITLLGPFRSLARGEIILDRVLRAIAGLGRIGCTIGDVVPLRGVRGGAIALHLVPGPGLLDVYDRLVSGLTPLATRCTWIDKPPGHRIFHISLRFNIPFREFDSSWQRTMEISPLPEYEQRAGEAPQAALRTYLRACDSPVDIFRVAIVRRGAVWKELDLPRGAWLSRAASLDPGEWKSTYRSFRDKEGMELQGDMRSSIPSRYLIADLHLGHRNIIQYCRRPFSSVEEMDEVLIGNWNHRVGPSDEVYCLGDLRHGSHARPASDYLSRLNGTVRLVTGNHDGILPGAMPSTRVRCGSHDLLLIHDPAGAPAGFPGWVIHGHLHNNDLAEYPFINAQKRTVNVSAELLDYIPVPLPEVCRYLDMVAPGEKLVSLKEARARYPEKWCL